MRWCAPFEEAITRLSEVPGIERTTAITLIAEIGPDMTRFPTERHLASWAGYAPKARASAGRKRGRQATSHGSRYLAAALGETAISAGKTQSFLGARYRKLAHRIGTSKANVAVGRSTLTIIWHLLSDPSARYTDLGPDWYDRRMNGNRQRNNHIRGLQALGYRVTIEPVA